MELADEYSRSRVWQIYERLYPKPPDLVDNNRFFVREGELFVWSEKDKKKKRRYFFLFNDILLLCKREGSRKFWLRVHITLRSPHVQVEESGGYDPLEFRLRCRTRTFLLWASSGESKKSWMQDIKDSVEGKHEETVKKKDKKKKKSSQKDKPKIEPLKPIKKKADDDTPVPILPPPPGRGSKHKTHKMAQSQPSTTTQTQPLVQPAPTNPTPNPSNSNLIDLLDFDPFANTAGQPSNVQVASNPFSQFGGGSNVNLQNTQPMMQNQPNPQLFSELAFVGYANNTINPFNQQQPNQPYQQSAQPFAQQPFNQPFQNTQPFNQQQPFTNQALPNTYAQQPSNTGQQQLLFDMI